MTRLRDTAIVLMVVPPFAVQAAFVWQAVTWAAGLIASLFHG